jgi:predicted O-methyltransferase YrrM
MASIFRMDLLWLEVIMVTTIASAETGMIRTNPFYERSAKFTQHRYHIWYDKWLKPYQNKPNLKMLEIGVFQGKSLLMWADYFVDAELILGLAYGDHIDLARQTISQSGKKQLKIIEGDQSKEFVMARLCKEGPFNVIVDDGSHVPWHVIFSFSRLWPCLNPGGLYVVEDLETSYHDKNPKFKSGIGQPPPGNAVEKMKQLIDVLNRYQMGYTELSIIPGDQDICSMNFGMNVMSLEKCSAEEKQMTEGLIVRERVNKNRMLRYIKQAKLSNP